MRSLLFWGVCALIVPACALAQSAAPPPAAKYMMMAGQSDAFEVASGKLAAAQGAAPGIKAFGAQMVTDHTKSAQMVMAAAEKSGLPVGPPPPLSADQKAMLTDLRGQSGAAFDKAYLAQQMAAHKEALALQTGYAKGGDDPNLEAAAGDIVPVVKMHIAMLQKLSAAGM